MADSTDSKQYIVATTKFPTATFEGNWTLEDFPAVIQRARTPRADGQEIPPEIAHLNFEINCKVG